MIQITSSTSEIAYVTTSDAWGGKKYSIDFTHDMLDMIRWYKSYQEQLLKESRAREQFPAVAAAYEQYQMSLKLVLDQI